MRKLTNLLIFTLSASLLMQVVACQGTPSSTSDPSESVSENTHDSSESIQDEDPTESEAGSITVHLSDQSTSSRETTSETSRTRTSAYQNPETSKTEITTELILPGNTTPEDSTTRETVPPETTVVTTGNEAIDRLLEQSAGAFVYDLASGERLLWHEPQEQIETASIGKVATVLFAKTLIDSDDVIRVGDEVSLISPTSSLAFVSKGMRLKLSMLIEGMMLPSGNDAAYAVAAAGGRRLRNVDDLSQPYDGGATQAQDDVDRFMEALNVWALEQGMVGSSWATPDGYRHPEQYTTLADMVTLGELASTDSELLKITAASSDRVMYESGETMNWENGNQLVNRESAWFRNDVVGLKTGSFFDYFNVLILERETDGQQRLVGVFGMPYTKDRFDLATLLLDEIRE